MADTQSKQTQSQHPPKGREKEGPAQGSGRRKRNLDRRHRFGKPAIGIISSLGLKVCVEYDDSLPLDNELVSSLPHTPGERHTLLITRQRQVSPSGSAAFLPLHVRVGEQM